jgi:hypothetical protein
MAGAVSFVNSHNTELGSFPDTLLECDSLLDGMKHVKDSLTIFH